MLAGAARQWRQRVQPKACRRGPSLKPHCLQRVWGVKAAPVQGGHSDSHPLPMEGEKQQLQAMHTGGVKADTARAAMKDATDAVRDRKPGLMSFEWTPR